MLKQYSLVFLLLFSAFLLVKGQEYQIPTYQVSVSFFGEMLTHRGVRLGLTTPLSQQIVKSENGQGVNRAWVVGGYLTYYRHPRNHHGLMLTGAIGRQRIGRSGLMTQMNFEAGYMLSVLDGEVYARENDQIVSGTKGSSHMVLGFNGGMGWDFGKKSHVPLSIMIQPHFYLQTPYNTLAAPRFALETKLSYTLK